MKRRLVKPVLVLEYTTAVREVYGAFAKVRTTDYPKFEAREKELMEAGYSPRQYSIAVARLWRGWVTRQKLRQVPVNVFLGPKSWERFLELDLQVSVQADVDKASAVVLNDELTVARLYVMSVVGGSPIPIRKIAASMNLSDGWWDAFERQQRPISEAAKVICREYGIDYRRNYNTIGEFVRGRKLRMGREVQGTAHCPVS